MENKVIGVRFKRTGKLFYFNPLDFGFRIGDNIIAETDRGEELGRVVKIVDKDIMPKNVEIKNIIKPATKKDLETFKEIEQKAKEALDFCKQEVKKQNLNMKVLTAEYTFDMSKLTFYFVSEDRVDFRELVKILASKFKSRIELRQIGPRDEIKVYPNLGMCGKEVCCRTFLENFDPVTIKMAKEQGLQINMSKLSGACGKLMCCLRYEENVYKENLKKMPKVGQMVTKKDPSKSEKGKVVSTDILNLKVRVKFGEEDQDQRFENLSVDEIDFKSNLNKNEEEIE